MIQILQGDCRDVLKTLPSESVHCVVTSPPYWGLRDYGVEGQLGLEKTPEEYVAKMVAVFREVRRVLREDGTLWLNMGDSYTCTPAGNKEWKHGAIFDGRDMSGHHSGKASHPGDGGSYRENKPKMDYGSLKPKDLCGIPWRLAFALQSDGWWLRQDIIWHKPNPMPESVTDRCTKAHEYLFLLAKSAQYFFDAEAIREPHQDAAVVNGKYTKSAVSADDYEGRKWHESCDGSKGNRPPMTMKNREYNPSGRNRRSVWTINSEPYPESHFATFPTALVKPCILAGTSAKGCCPKCGAPWEREVNRVPAVSKPCPKTTPAHLARGGTGEPIGTVGKSGGGRIDGFTETLGWYPSCRCNNDDDDYEVEPIPCTVLDPFGGSGTVGQVALELGRKAILIELNPAYVKLAEKRTNVTPGLQLA